MMMNFDIISIARFCNRERRRYVAGVHSLGILVSGFQRIEVMGTELPSLPCINIVAAGTEAVVHASGNRENIACLFRSDDWRASAQRGFVEFRMGDAWLQLPAFVPVTQEEAARWQYELRVMSSLLKRPLAGDLFRLKLHFYQLIQAAMDHTESVSLRQPSVAVKFRQLLDEPLGMQQPLHELARRCGYSIGHASNAFREEFGITPKAYQQERRLSHAMDLITNSGLSVKQIAAECGFRFPSHFSAAFRAAYGMPPKTAARLYRV